MMPARPPGAVEVGLGETGGRMTPVHFPVD
jgi:hypothetical protein